MVPGWPGPGWLPQDVGDGTIGTLTVVMKYEGNIFGAFTFSMVFSHENEVQRNHFPLHFNILFSSLTKPPFKTSYIHAALLQ